MKTKLAIIVLLAVLTILFLVWVTNPREVPDKVLNAALEKELKDLKINCSMAVTETGWERSGDIHRTLLGRKVILWGCKYFYSVEVPYKAQRDLIQIRFLTPSEERFLDAKRGQVKKVVGNLQFTRKLGSWSYEALYGEPREIPGYEGCYIKDAPWQWYDTPEEMARYKDPFAGPNFSGEYVGGTNISGENVGGEHSCD